MFETLKYDDFSVNFIAVDVYPNPAFAHGIELSTEHQPNHKAVGIVDAKLGHIGSLMQPTARDATKFPHSVTINELRFYESSHILRSASCLVCKLNDEGVLHWMNVFPDTFADPLDTGNPNAGENHIG